MKKIVTIISLVLSMFITAGCSSKSEPDFTAVEAETALNEGEDITGKTVEITVKEFVPDSAFGYNIITGEHLNFVSSSNPNVKEGDTLVVTVKEVQSVLGSYIISYEKE